MSSSTMAPGVTLPPRFSLGNVLSFGASCASLLMTSGCLLYSKLSGAELTPRVFATAYLAGAGALMVNYLLDVFVGTTYSRNLPVLKKNGYSFTYCLVNGTAILWCAELAFAGLVAFHYDAWNVRIDLPLVLRVGAALAMADLYFYYAHRHLHRHLYELHKLHHCVFAPSFASNFTFHPLDFILEFGVPLGLSFVLYSTTNALGQFDPFAHFVAASIVQMWYAMDHDGLLRLAHYRHHTLLSSQYAVYAPWNTKRDDQEKMKDHIIR